jgi:hypothetical protein
MSLVKAKQLKFNSAGDIIVANVNSTGSLLPKGSLNTALFISSVGPSYQYVSSLNDPSLGTTLLSVSNNSLALNGENLQLSNTANEVVLTAVSNNPSANVDIRLVPQGNGQVYIGTSASTGSTLQADPGEILTIQSGDTTTSDGNGTNLILSGGSGNGTGTNGYVTGPSGYSSFLTSQVNASLAPTDAFATVGFVNNQVAAIDTNEYRDRTTIVIPIPTLTFTLSYAPVGDIEVMYNGLELYESDFSVVGKVVTITTYTVGYSFDTGDVVEYRYNYVI